MVKTNQIVQEFKDGNTIIKICDKYCKDTSAEQVKEILDRVEKKALEYFNQKLEN